MAQEISKKFSLNVPNKPLNTSAPTFSDQQSLQKPVLERKPGPGEEVVDMSDVEEFEPNKEID